MAFQKLLDDGVFSAYTAYSYLVRNEALQNHQQALDEFLQAVIHFAPTIKYPSTPARITPWTGLFCKSYKATPSGRTGVV